MRRLGGPGKRMNRSIRNWAADLAEQSGSAYEMTYLDKVSIKTIMYRLLQAEGVCIGPQKFMWRIWNTADVGSIDFRWPRGLLRRML